MNVNIIKRALVGIPIIAISMMISCSKVDVSELENAKNEIIDSLTNHIDSLNNVVAQRDSISQSIPHSIILLENCITLRDSYIAEIEFRVNPSHVNVDIKNFKLDHLSAETKGVSYITEPVNIKKVSVQKSKETYGSPQRGQYTMTIKDINTNKDFTETLAIVYETYDAYNNRTEVSSDPFTVISAPASTLQQVHINTPDAVPVESKEEWVKDATMMVTDMYGNEIQSFSTSIRGRGNSTWTFPKKPYALKLDSKEEVLGMPKHKRWVLLANWMDRTLLRNDIAFEMGRRIMQWAPRGEFVELYLNGKHLGNYYLCEQIKPDKNRVNIDEENGGYILEFDTYGPNDEINYFYTPVKSYPVTIKEPDEELITSWEHEGFLYIYNHLTYLENLLESDINNLTQWAEIEGLIDVNSYIDWWLIHELSHNWEPHHPKSCYMYKKQNDKLFAGPLWDFDWGTFMLSEGVIANETLWYGYFFRYTEFKKAVKARWAEVKETLSDIDSYIEIQAAHIKESNEVNIYKWPITEKINGDENLSFDNAILQMRKSYQIRFRVIDEYISEL